LWQPPAEIVVDAAHDEFNGAEGGNRL